MNDSLRKRPQAGPATPPGAPENAAAVLKEAIRNVPAVKWAPGVAGLAAVLYTVLKFRLDYKVAVFGIIILLVLMIMLVIFSHLAKTAARVFFVPIRLLIWFSTSLIILVPSLLLTSVFFNAPLPFREMYFSLPVQPNTQAPNSKKPDPQAEGKQSTAPASQVLIPPRTSATPVPQKAGANAPGRVQGTNVETNAIQVKSDAKTPNPNQTSTDCDNLDPDRSVATSPKVTDAFVRSLDRKILDVDRKPIQGVEVRCGASGAETRVTDIEGAFSCTLPAHTTWLLVEINDQSFQHFHRLLNAGCSQPILLKHNR